MLEHAKLKEKTCGAETQNESTLNQSTSVEATNADPSRLMVGKVTGGNICPKLGGCNLSCDPPGGEC